MSTIIVPTPDGTAPAHRQVTPLGGVDYVLTFRYSTRCVGWHLDVDVYPSTRVITGARIRPGINLLSDTPSAGVLHVLNVDGGKTSPDRTAFAERRSVLYYDPTWEGMP